MNTQTLISLLIGLVVVGAVGYYMIGQSEVDNTDAELVPPVITQEVRLKGTITKEPVTNKRGERIEGVHDYFFEVSDDEWYFVHAHSTVNEELLEMFGDQEVTVRGEIGEGQWDSDDPQVSSRIGPYIVIENIFK